MAPERDEERAATGRGAEGNGAEGGNGLGAETGGGEDGRRTIAVQALARVEGEGAMSVRLRDGEVLDVQLRIYEPPRFFEAFLRGRSMREVSDITARICGICPVAYQMSAAQAIEQACGIVLSGPVLDLRRLIYCGEWLESHALHLYMLHAPDFTGYAGAIEMAAEYPELVERGLRTKKVGNALIAAIGGRAVHPVNVQPGGFFKAPPRAALREVREGLLRAREEALETVRWTAGLDYPDHERDVELVALRSPAGDYPIERGAVVSTEGIEIEARDFDTTFEELQVPHSNALHARVIGRGAYMTGPLARFALNFDRLSDVAREAALEAGIDAGCRNSFKSIIVRAVEILYALDEAIRLIDVYEPPDPPALELEPVRAVGHGVTEAPRGLLYHRYEIDEQGTILDARIVPPTSQNQMAIEEDLRGFVASHAGLPDLELGLRCEQAIRNYDPCISCATHFLRFEIERG